MDFTIEMALVDYVPVLFFAIAGIILMCDLYNKMSVLNFALFAVGVADIAIAGACKATWKLIYASSQINVEFLNKMFFPTQSMGFLLAGLALVIMLIAKKNRGVRLHSVMGYIAIMVSGLAFMDAVLCIVAVKLKKPWLIAIFALSFVCSLCMGYLSSQDFAKASMNWIAEGVNVVGQGTLLIGAWLLHKNGLADLELHGGEGA
jgi:hypothetical protein